MAMKYGFHIVSVIVLLMGIILLVPSSVSAHRSGCHNLHTCPSDSNTYVCGDLGYPCDGSTSIAQISANAVYVPLAVEKIFTETFGRKPTDMESAFWKKRFRDDKGSIYKIRPAMGWHKAHGSFGPKATVVSSRDEMVKNINTYFQSVYDGRLPSASESAYWISRVKDKTTPPAMIGAMTFHKANNIQH